MTNVCSGTPPFLHLFLEEKLHLGCNALVWQYFISVWILLDRQCKDGAMLNEQGDL